MHRLPALQQLWEASFTFPVNTGSSWVLCCGFLFCLNYALSCSHSEGNNLWRNFSRVYEVLIISPLWQIVFPTCWSSMSYSSKPEQPADLIPAPVWALQIPAARLGTVGAVPAHSCAGEGQADLHLGTCLCVEAQKGSSSAFFWTVFSTVVNFLNIFHQSFLL